MNKNWMHKSYWKWMGIALFLYVLIGGLTTPLHPGILRIVPDTARAGDTLTAVITTYNAHYDNGQNNKAWLKLDSVHLLPAEKTEALNPNELKAFFLLPARFPESMRAPFLTVITHNTADGFALRPNALRIVADTLTGEDAAWQSALDPGLQQGGGLRFPFRSILDETIRNTFFHIALWLAMMVLLVAGLYHSIRFLITKDLRHDKWSSSYHQIAILYGILGLITGSIWARFTWGTWWTADVKLNMSAIAMLMYLAYLILRSANLDFDKRARLSAVYSIFAFFVLIPLIFIIPRMTDSLHPGNGGNPALGGEDLDHTLRLFFYPSIIALILIGIWISSLVFRSEVLKEKLYSKI